MKKRMIVLVVFVGVGLIVLLQRILFASPGVTLDYVVAKAYIPGPGGHIYAAPPEELFVIEAQITNHHKLPVYFLDNGCASPVFQSLQEENNVRCLMIAPTERLDAGHSKIFSTVLTKAQTYRFELDYWLWGKEKHSNGFLGFKGENSLTSDPIQYTESNSYQ